MTLNAPTTIVFLISVLVALVAVIAAFGVLSVIPVPAFWIMTAAYIILVLACLVSGL